MIEEVRSCGYPKYVVLAEDEWFARKLYDRDKQGFVWGVLPGWEMSQEGKPFASKDFLKKWSCSTGVTYIVRATKEDISIV